jgi:hypothetical protein
VPEPLQHFLAGDGGPELADLAVGLPGVHDAAVPVHICIGADYLPVAPLRHIVQCHRVRGGQGRDTAFLTWMSGRRCQAPWSSTTWWRTNMPQIHLVPVNQGMTREELAQRLQSGWVLVGRQAANVAQGIIDPFKCNYGLTTAWVSRWATASLLAVEWNWSYPRRPNAFNQFPAGLIQSTT